MGWGKISCCEKVKSLFSFKDEANTIEAIFLSPLHKAEFIPDIYVWFFARWDFAFVLATLQLQQLLVLSVNMYLCSCLEQGECKRFSTYQIFGRFQTIVYCMRRNYVFCLFFLFLPKRAKKRPDNESASKLQDLPPHSLNSAQNGPNQGLKT